MQSAASPDRASANVALADVLKGLARINARLDTMDRRFGAIEQRLPGGPPPAPTVPPMPGVNPDVPTAEPVPPIKGAGGLLPPPAPVNGKLDRLSVLTAKCAACHSSGSAADKGGNLRALHAHGSGWPCSRPPRRPASSAPTAITRAPCRRRTVAFRH